MCALNLEWHFVVYVCPQFNFVHIKKFLNGNAELYNFRDVSSDTMVGV